MDAMRYVVSEQEANVQAGGWTTEMDRNSWQDWDSKRPAHSFFFFLLLPSQWQRVWSGTHMLPFHVYAFLSSDRITIKLIRKKEQTLFGFVCLSSVSHFVTVRFRGSWFIAGTNTFAPIRVCYKSDVVVEFGPLKREATGRRRGD